MVEYLTDEQLYGPASKADAGDGYLSDEQLYGPATPESSDSALSYSVDRAQELIGQGIQTLEDVAGFDTGFGQSIVEQQQLDIAEGRYQSKYTGSLLDQETVGDMGGWVWEKMQENAATSAPALVGGAAAALTAPISIPTALAITGVTGLTSFAMGAGEVAQEMKDMGVYDPKVAIAGGAVIALLDRVGARVVNPASGVKQLLKMGVKKEAAEEMVKEVAKKGITREIMERALTEGFTETLQEGVNVAAAASQGATYDPKELGKRAVDALVLGAGMGGGMAAPTVAVERLRAPGVTRDQGENSMLNEGDLESPIDNETLQLGFEQVDELLALPAPEQADGRRRTEGEGFTVTEGDPQAPLQIGTDLDEDVIYAGPPSAIEVRPLPGGVFAAWVDGNMVAGGESEAAARAAAQEVIAARETGPAIDVAPEAGQRQPALPASEARLALPAPPETDGRRRTEGEGFVMPEGEPTAPLQIEAQPVTAETPRAGEGFVIPEGTGEPARPVKKAKGEPIRPARRDPAEIRAEAVDAVRTGELTQKQANAVSKTGDGRMTSRDARKLLIEAGVSKEDVTARIKAATGVEKTAGGAWLYNLTDLTTGAPSPLSDVAPAEEAAGALPVPAAPTLNAAKAYVASQPGGRVISIKQLAKALNTTTQNAGLLRSKMQGQGLLTMRSGAVPQHTVARDVVAVIKDLGGIQPSGETRGYDLQRTPGLVGKDAPALNEIRNHLEDIGMLPKGSRDDAVVDLIRENETNKQYHPDDEHLVRAEEDERAVEESAVQQEEFEAQQAEEQAARDEEDLSRPEPGVDEEPIVEGEPVTEKEIMAEPEVAAEEGVIPGAERISDKDLVERKMAEPKKAEAEQKAPGEDGGLFDVAARDQGDIQFKREPGKRVSRRGYEIEDIGGNTISANHPKNAEHRDKLQQKVSKLVRRVGGRKAKVVVVDAIRETVDGRPAGAAGGMFRASDGTIFVSMGSLDALGSARHELIHFLRQTGAISDSQWKVLKRRAKEWRTKYEIDERYSDLTKEQRDEEAIAEAFDAYGRGELDAKGLIGRIFQTITEFVEGIRSLIDSGDFTTAKQLLADAEAGKFARDTTTTTGPSAASDTKFQRAQRENSAYTRLSEKDKSLWDKAKTAAWNATKRNLFPGGNLPTDVFEAKIARDNKFNAAEMETNSHVSRLEEATGKKWGEMTKAEQDTFHRAMQGDVDPRLKPEVREAIFAMRQYIDSLSAEYGAILYDEIETLKESGVSDEILRAKVELLNTLAENAGKYINRSYRAFDDPKWVDKVPRDVYERATDYLIGEGMTATEAEKKIELLLKEGTAYDSFESFIKESKLGAKDLSVLKKRMDIAEPIRELLGEYKDPRLNFSRTAAKMAHLIHNTHFLNRVKEMGEGVFLFNEANRPLGATTKIASKGAKGMDPLGGYYTYPEVEQAFRDALGKEESPNWLRMVVQVNGMVKYGKTVLSPTTAARNYMSGYFFTVHSGHYDYTHMQQAMKSARNYFKTHGGGDPYLKHLTEIGVLYDTPFAGELIKLLEDSKLEDMVLRGTAAGEWTRHKLDKLTKFYQFGDDLWKIVGFENELASLMKNKHGITKDSSQAEYEAARKTEEKEAARRIRDTYPTYSMVGRGIRRLRKFPLVGTFVSFPAEIIRTHFNSLKYAAKDIQDPKMRKAGARRLAGIAVSSSAMYAAAQLSKALVGIDDDEEEAIRLGGAPWSQNSNLLFIGRDEKGSPQMIDLTFLDPYGYFQRPLTAMMRDQPIDEAVVSAGKDLLSPFLGIDILAGGVMEVWQNKKDSGGRIYNPEAPAIDQTADIADHLRKAMQPGAVSLVERIGMAMTGTKSRSGREYRLGEEMAGAIGWRMSTFDPVESIKYKTFEFTDRLKNSSALLSSTLRDQGNVTDDEIRESLADARDARQAAYDDFEHLVSSAMKVGATKPQLRKVLRASGVSKATASDLVNLRPMRTWKPALSSIRGELKSRRALGDRDAAKELLRRLRVARRSG